MFLVQAHTLPGNEAFGAITYLLSRPQEDPTTSIKGFHDSLGEEEAQHVVYWQAAQNHRDQSDVPPQSLADALSSRRDIDRRN
jgi:hypothetical protein